MTKESKESVMDRFKDMEWDNDYQVAAALIFTRLSSIYADENDKAYATTRRAFIGKSSAEFTMAALIMTGKVDASLRDKARELCGAMPEFCVQYTIQELVSQVKKSLLEYMMPIVMVTEKKDGDEEKVIKVHSDALQNIVANCSTVLDMIREHRPDLFTAKPEETAS